MPSAVFKIQEHVLPCQHIRGYPRTTSTSQEDVLHIAIKQYTPLDNPNPKPGDVTIIGAHANGVGKELYEPLWEDLYSLIKSRASWGVRSIWIADVSFQGASYVLNEGKLGNDPSWFDHPRDLLHMINHFRDQMPRPLVGFGHSMGGHNIGTLSLLHPRLFTAVLLVDPVIQRSYSSKGNISPAYLSSFRRDLWPSREEASTAFLRSKFYQAWDPRVFERWVEFGLRDLPTRHHPTYSPKPSSKKSNSKASAPPAAPSPPPERPVTLTTPKHYEVWTFLRANFPKPGKALAEHKFDRRKTPDLPSHAVPSKPFYRPEPLLIFDQLPHLRPRCFYIFASESDLSRPEFREERLAITGTAADGNGGVAEGGTHHVVVQDAGHFVAFEKPKEVARHIVDWLGPEMDRWKDQEELEAREWEATSEHDRLFLSEEYLYWLKGNEQGWDVEGKPRTDKL